MFEQTAGTSHRPLELSEDQSNTHQTPFYVFPVLERGKLLTLPEGRLINGHRNAVTSHERNAIQIGNTHNLILRGKGVLAITEGAGVNGYGYVAEPVWRSRIPEYEDFTTDNPSKDHTHGLELHDHPVLLKQLQKQVRREKDKNSKDRREAEIAFIKAFGAFLLGRHI